MSSGEFAHCPVTVSTRCRLVGATLVVARLARLSPDDRIGKSASYRDVRPCGRQKGQPQGSPLHPPALRPPAKGRPYIRQPYVRRQRVARTSASPTSASHGATTRVAPSALASAFCPRRCKPSSGKPTPAW